MKVIFLKTPEKRLFKLPSGQWWRTTTWATCSLYGWDADRFQAIIFETFRPKAPMTYGKEMVFSLWISIALPRGTFWKTEKNFCQNFHFSLHNPFPTEFFWEFFELWPIGMVLPVKTQPCDAFKIQRHAWNRDKICHKKHRTKFFVKKLLTFQKTHLSKGIWHVSPRCSRMHWKWPKIP